MNILGINAYHGDASAALVVDGKLVAAAEEERFNRVKHCAGFPTRAIQFCLAAGGLDVGQLDHLAVSRNPKAHLLQKVLYSLGKAHQLGGMIKDRLYNAMKVRDLRRELANALGVDPARIRGRLHYVEHHQAHLASAFFVSPFEEALVLSVDGMGDFVSTMYGQGKSNEISVFDQVLYPHSLGMLYTATSQYLGFHKYGDEGKVMGLAPYGRPVYLEAFERMVRLLDDGRFELNLDYFTHHESGVQMTWDEGSPVLGMLFSNKFEELLGPARQTGAPLTRREEDVAASLQAMTEKTLFAILRQLRRRSASVRLCLGGGVALNSVFNAKIFDHTDFRELYVQPAAGDDGTAIGAAFHVLHQVLHQPRSFVMTHAYTGPAFSDAEIAAAIAACGLRSETFADEKALLEATAQAIAEGAVVGWFQGGMEFGPRALGHRSIVVDPRRPEMKEILNRRIKHREPFRPFAPSVLLEHTGDYFERTYPSPFMLLVYKVREDKRQVIPAVTHVDQTGRLQTVDRENSPRYYKLIEAFYRKSGVPVVLNTSFNENEPIVCTPQDALHCFQKTQMDVLVLGNHFLRRISG